MIERRYRRNKIPSTSATGACISSSSNGEASSIDNIAAISSSSTDTSISSSSCSSTSAADNNEDRQQNNNSLRKTRGNTPPPPRQQKNNDKKKSTIHSLFPSFGADNSNEDNDDPARRMLHTWLFCIMLPSAVIIWYQTRSYAWALAGTLAIPVLAILQGSWGILNFRLWFGDAPVPQAPVHGVVVATASAASNNSSNIINNSNPPTNTQGKQQQRHYSSDAGGTTISDEQNSFLEEAVRHPPIRLLVIGDSLAIGVGQSSSATPIMPEAMASTLSKKLGRVVYWTCHGAPGASAGWIVRELERGIAFKDNEEENDDDEHNSCSGITNEEDEGIVLIPPSSPQATKNQQSPFAKAQSTFLRCPSETDESSSDESSAADESQNNNELPPPMAAATNHNKRARRQQQQQQQQAQRSGVAIHNNILPTKNSSKQLTLWKDRLEHHRKRFTRDVMGPYDIVVVLTGSNDLKSAFFPFLLTGEDAELRRQAQERGGSYTKELRILVETLYRKMQLRWQSIRHAVVEQVEAATESVREKVGETMERFSSTNHQQHHPHNEINNNNNKHSSSLSAAASCRIDGKSNVQAQSTPFSPSLPFRRMEQSLSPQQHTNPSCVIQQKGNSRRFPLVVLPGMPARALPIFRVVPLRWLAVPIVDIMDMHKRNLAKSHPGEMLFVKAPGVEDLGEYGNQQGVIWNDRCNEDTILALRDIRKRDRRRIEHEMHNYYSETKSGRRISSTRSPPPSADGSELFSVDRIHPNDKGYDFWGRFIGNAIVDEWLSLRADK